MQHTTSRTLRRLAVPVAALGLLAACGGDSASGSDNALVEYFVSQDAPRDEAECVAGELGEFDPDEVIAAFEGEEAPANEALVEALFAAVTTCGVE